MNARKLYSVKFLIIDMWLILLLLGIGLCVFLFYFHNALQTERDTIYIEKTALFQTNKLRDSSDFLTNTARFFAITGNPKYIRNYWNEVTLTKTRDKVIASFDTLNIPNKERQSLALAKENSNLLIETEARSMRLILLAMGLSNNNMPPALIGHGNLLSGEFGLSAMDKINLAQTILFNETYFKNKDSIINPIKKFERIMQVNLANETQKARALVDQLFTMIVSMTILIAALLLSIIWLKHGLDLKEQKNM